MLGSSGSGSFSPLCSLGRFAEDRIIRGRAALAPRHRRKAPRALLPGVQTSRLWKLPAVPSGGSSQKKRRLGTGGAQRMLAHRTSAGDRWIRSYRNHTEGARGAQSPFFLGLGPPQIAMRAKTHMPEGGGVGVI